MEIAVNKKFTRFLLGFALMALISVALFGISPVMMGMEMNNNGQMGGCPFSGVVAICKMSPLEHVVAWQKMFTTTAPQRALALNLLVLLSVVFVAVAIFKRNLLLLFSYYATRWRLYIRHNPNISLFNYLQKAFSQGILNPKIYELVTI